MIDSSYSRTWNLLQTVVFTNESLLMTTQNSLSKTQNYEDNFSFSFIYLANNTTSTILINSQIPST